MPDINQISISDKNIIAGVVLLYNPNDTLLNNIDLYVNDVGCLYILDNSEIPNSHIAGKIRKYSNVEYIHFKENLGVAKALNIAAKLAEERGYTYLLTMDQDSKVPDKMVNSLLRIIERDEMIGIVSPLHSNKYNTHLKFPQGIHQVNIAMTSGNIISLPILQQLKGFCEDLFIDYVDIEYCFRLAQNGYKIIQNNDVILEHKEANLSERKMFGMIYYPHNHSPFRWYYKTRNLLYLRKKYGNRLKNLMRIEYDAYLRMVIKLILFENQRVLKLWYIVIGVIDYLKNKKGKKLFQVVS